jgi:hypothetical protein
MKKSTFFGLVMILMLVVSSWVPAEASQSTERVEASTVGLTITNKMPKATTVNLTGASNYTIYVNTGATVTKNINGGAYKYSYAGCGGKIKKGALKIKGSTASLVIPACGMLTLTIVNQTSQAFSWKLTGWMNYNINVGAGQTKTVQLVSGTYDGEMKVCGKTYTAKWKVGKGKKTWLIRC